MDSSADVEHKLGVDVQMAVSRPAGIWTYPVETVSQSEAGFEAVHQSVVLHPHWLVQGDVNGKWYASIKLTADTSLAESRMKAELATAEV